MHKLCLIVAAVSVILCPFAAVGFEVRTHRDMNEAAVGADNDFDSFLVNVMNFPDCHVHILNEKRVEQWISDGGADEDELWLNRPLNHFHDPLRPWTSAGFGHGVYPSSVVWMQGVGSDLES